MEDSKSENLCCSPPDRDRDGGDGQDQDQNDQGQDQDDGGDVDDTDHLAEPGEVPAHHDLVGGGEERQDVRPALGVLQRHLQDWPVLVTTDLVVIMIYIL